MKLGVFLCSLVLAGCARGFGSPALPGGIAQNESAFATSPQAAGYKVLHSFKGGADGAKPAAGLFAVNGVLYGTTQFGGNGGHSHCGGNFIDSCGTIFSTSTSGAERVIYAFNGGPNGSNPVASLIDVNGTLYGTAEYGGTLGCGNGDSASPCGTVFATSTSGTVRSLYTFKSLVVANPVTALTVLNGTFYGTTPATEVGGRGSGACVRGHCGAVFSLGAGGTLHVLHRFKDGSDGADPEASLTPMNGVLYGTTASGGLNEYGTVFQIDASGAESVLYRFNGGSDGAKPQEGLIAVNGVLYGTTSAGGTGACTIYAGPNGCGTVFSVSASGRERVLYRFKGGADGAFPAARLALLNGTFFGTTVEGGGPCQNYTRGCGTAFAVSPSGQERVLHRFKGGADGALPARLTALNGELYGTTYDGGVNSQGTIFKLTPSTQ